MSNFQKKALQNTSMVSLKCFATLSCWKLDPPRNCNNVGSYTFVTLIHIPPTPLHYVTLEWSFNCIFTFILRQRNGQRVRAEQVEDILDLIPRRGQHAFEEFCSALSASDQERIVKEYLKPAVKVVEEQDQVVAEEDIVVIPSQCMTDYVLQVHFWTLSFS